MVNNNDRLRDARLYAKTLLLDLDARCRQPKSILLDTQDSSLTIALAIQLTPSYLSP